MKWLSLHVLSVIPATFIFRVFSGVLVLNKVNKQIPSLGSKMEPFYKHEMLVFILKGKRENLIKIFKGKISSKYHKFIILPHGFSWESVAVLDLLPSASDTAPPFEAKYPAKLGLAKQLIIAYQFICACIYVVHSA